MKRVLLIAAMVVLPGGMVVGAGWFAYRWAVRRAARREVAAELARLGAPMPRTEARA